MRSYSGSLYRVRSLVRVRLPIWGAYSGNFGLIRGVIQAESWSSGDSSGANLTFSEELLGGQVALRVQPCCSVVVTFLPQNIKN